MTPKLSMDYLNNFEFANSTINFYRTTKEYIFSHRSNKKSLDSIVRDLQEKKIIPKEEKKLILYAPSNVPIIVETRLEDGTLTANSSELWNACPNLDVLAYALNRAVVDKKDFFDVVVLSEEFHLSPYGLNSVAELIAGKNNNPYSSLKNFVRKKYDGSLGFEEFKGYRFGDMGGRAYEISLIYGDRKMCTLESTHCNLVNRKFDIKGSKYKITSLEHKKFKIIPYCEGVSKYETQCFSQVLEADLSFKSFNYDKCDIFN
jgi:hypothetical protein